MRRWFPILAALLLGLAFLPFAHPQELAKRLILKDGSYQAVTKWEVKGDRVRYFSAERNDWEELPNSLVDWDATNKYNQAREAGAPPPEIQQQLDKELDLDAAKDEAPTLQAAPGLNLPDFEGVFVLDAYRGQPQLLELQQDAGDLNRNIKRNVLAAAINPLASAKQSIELPGEHAPVQIHQGRPAIFINMAPDQPDATLQQKDTQQAAESGNSKKQKKEKKGKESAAEVQAGQPYRLVRLQTKDGKRILGNLKIAVYGKVSQEQKFVPSTSERLMGNWMKITPSADLQPGEYAVVEMLDPKQMNLYVWDFGVNPSAPANPMAWKPAAPAPKPANTKPPSLQPRPKSQ